MGLFFYSFLALANSNKTGIARPLFGRFVANVVREKETMWAQLLTVLFCITADIASESGKGHASFKGNFGYYQTHL